MINAIYRLNSNVCAVLSSSSKTISIGEKSCRGEVELLVSISVPPDIRFRKPELPAIFWDPVPVPVAGDKFQIRSGSGSGQIFDFGNTEYPVPVPETGTSGCFLGSGSGSGDRRQISVPVRLFRLRSNFHLRNRTGTEISSPEHHYRQYEKNNSRNS